MVMYNRSNYVVLLLLVSTNIGSITRIAGGDEVKSKWRPYNFVKYLLKYRYDWRFTGPSTPIEKKVLK